MEGMNYLIYDCEIIKLIPPKNGEPDPNYQYCQGWNDHANMGISCIAWAHSNGSEGVFTFGGSIEEHEMFTDAFVDLCWRSDKLIGFNSKNFDDKLIAANGICQYTDYMEKAPITTDFDLLELVRLAAYGSTFYKDCPKGHSYALGKIGEVNGFPKTGSGELAPKLWQDGERREVIEYCLNDVRITRELFELALEGKLIDPNTGKELSIYEWVDPE